MKHEKTATELAIIARAPFHIYYEGKARVVSATNQVGRFDILPGHADFFSVLIPCDVSIETDDNTITFPVTGGIVAVRTDEVMIFVNM
jgi:F0F1-type ATP synthase epsilon subunit